MVEPLLHRRNGLEYIGLARPVPARAVDSPEQVQLDLPLVRDRRHGPAAADSESEINSDSVVLILPPVHPHIEPRGLRSDRNAAERR